MAFDEDHIAAQPPAEGQITPHSNIAFPSDLAIAPARSEMGHEGRFALASVSAGYEFRKETIAGTHGNERDAPKAAILASLRWYFLSQ
jgi:hypothetical protein